MTVLEMLNAFGVMNSAGDGALEVKIKMDSGELHAVAEIDVVRGVEEIAPDAVPAAPYATISM